MPELPDVTMYREALEGRVVGATLKRLELRNPFLLRSVEPGVAEVEGKRVVGIERIGKRFVFALESELFIVVHLMIAGRLRWLADAAKPPGRITLALFVFDRGRLAFTEAGSKRRASLHIVRGRDALAQFDPGGIDVLDIDLARFASRLLAENHTLKRALTDPRLFSGIGNAYSDEILHRAKLSPIAHTQRLTPEAIAQLYTATREVLKEWIVRLRTEAAGGFPENVTAFRPEMAVHGKFGKPCPVCGAPVQRIVYAENECNYCARCQTGGKLLADRSLSRLLHASWPRSIDALE